MEEKMRLRQKMKLYWKFFVKLMLDLEFSVQEQQREDRTWTYSNFVRKGKGKKGKGLRVICLSRERREKGFWTENNLSKRGASKAREEESRAEKE